MRHVILAILTIAFSLSAKAQKQREQPMPWRGVMIDVSRHFFPIDELYRQVDIMSDCGLNTLHLHLTDAAGWRIEIKAYPRLTSVGAWRTRRLWKDWWNAPLQAPDTDLSYLRAYSDETRGYGGYYTQAELRALADYAQQKGVMVVPEIEFPGHSEEVCAAYPQIAYNHAEMDLSKPETYEFMRNVLSEVAAVFPSPYIHCGGDETATQKEHYFEGIRRLNDIVKSLGRKMIVWDEALSESEQDSSIIIMVWRNPELGERATRLGHQVIMCPSAWCYLDSYQDAPEGEPEAMGGYRPLQKVWEMGETLPHRQDNLLGVQATIFTEYVPTPQLLQYQLWPRALAISEIGHRRRRPYEEFRIWALHIADSLRHQGVNAFDLRQEKGQRKEYYTKAYHKAYQSKVTYNEPCQYSKAYCAGGEAALVDGNQGSWNNNDGRWQGFCCDLDITIDLGSERQVSSVAIPFMQILGPEIYLPAQVTINDELCQGEIKDAPFCITTYTLDKPLKTRTLHIKAQRSPRRGWLFVDEVVVR